MEYSANIVLLIILSSTNHTSASEDCEFAANTNKNNEPMEINARRQVKDKLSPVMKYKFGITYPPGVKPYSGYTYPTPGYSHKTPPTNYFPLGSSVVTVTMLPMYHMYAHTHSLGRECDFLVRTCMKAYDTGYVCGRSLHHQKHSFENYCAMDYTNCRQRADTWQLYYFGSCILPNIPDSGIGTYQCTVAHRNSPILRALTLLNALLVSAPECDLLAWRWAAVCQECLEFCEAMDKRPSSVFIC